LLYKGKEGGTEMKKYTLDDLRTGMDELLKKEA
jgi:hypothetical protein